MLYHAAQRHGEVDVYSWKWLDYNGDKPQLRLHGEKSSGASGEAGDYQI